MPPTTIKPKQLEKSGHTIEAEGTPTTPRTNLNFIGLTVEDDPGNDATNITGSVGTPPVTTAGILYIYANYI